MALLEGKNVTRAFGASKPLTRWISRFGRGNPGSDRTQRGRENHFGQSRNRNLPANRGGDLLQGDAHNRFETGQGQPPGIARTFQIVQPFPGMSLRENVVVGALFGKNGAGRSTKEAFGKRTVGSISSTSRITATPRWTRSTSPSGKGWTWRKLWP